jgi:hypothetical protein
MQKLKFETLEELKAFLGEEGLSETKFCVKPDYVDAIIGLTDENKLVYDYDKMVEHLAKLYEAEEDIEDPYESAIEWIDFNCQIPYWEIVHSTEEDDCYILGDFGDELPERLSDHMKTVIGMNTYGCLIVDSELVTDQTIDEIESILKEYDVDYKIV